MGTSRPLEVANPHLMKSRRVTSPLDKAVANSAKFRLAISASRKRALDASFGRYMKRSSPLIAPFSQVARERYRRRAPNKLKLRGCRLPREAGAKRNAVTDATATGGGTETEDSCGFTFSIQCETLCYIHSNAVNQPSDSHQVDSALWIKVDRRWRYRGSACIAGLTKSFERPSTSRHALREIRIGPAPQDGWGVTNPVPDVAGDTLMFSLVQALEASHS
jgi:hypothetical protein